MLVPYMLGINWVVSEHSDNLGWGAGWAPPSPTLYSDTVLCTATISYCAVYYVPICFPFVTLSLQTITIKEAKV